MELTAIDEDYENNTGKIASYTDAIIKSPIPKSLAPCCQTLKKRF
ncbi:hypothetical protein ACFOPX_06520 [Helicobacter baculiformis]|uniref:Uncharacterized protein n=1 Tax=Helicobacter baculiformis TaxID=427351 RepID=A0ABV7ZM00_9HELI|nr:hypothetical protein [Helicobacter baculiformis]